jgi:hypothetical protein
MGGHALSVKTIRLLATSYHALEAKIVAQVKAVLPHSQCAAIVAYADKYNFGDMDLLIGATEKYNPFVVAKALDATEIVRNGPVTSLGIQTEEGVFQVDLIAVPQVSFDFALKYFAMNDLGNLLGRIAHKAGFKLGHLGLTYVVRDLANSDHVLDEIVVTRSWNEAIAFFGYDPVAYQAGFNGEFKNPEDLFRFAASSPYFNKDIFLLENRNAKSRVRDKKRQTYMAFLDWAATRSGLTAFDWSNKVRLREEFLNKARVRFPEFDAAYREVMKKFETDRLFHEKFNGLLVSEWSGLQHTDLGELMRELRSLFTDKEEMKRWVLSVSQDEVKALVLNTMVRV